MELRFWRYVVIGAALGWSSCPQTTTVNHPTSTHHLDHLRRLTTPERLDIKQKSASGPESAYTAAMFNALNRFMSRLDGDTPQRNQEQGSFGFQVLRNTNLQLAVEPWFDYIVGINGRPIVCLVAAAAVRRQVNASLGYSRCQPIRDGNSQLRWWQRVPRSLECQGMSCNKSQNVINDG